MMRVKPEKMKAAETVTASWFRFQGSGGITFQERVVTGTGVREAKVNQRERRFAIEEAAGRG
jgi:hypothetical protein